MENFDDVLSCLVSFPSLEDVSVSRKESYHYISALFYWELINHT